MCICKRNRIVSVEPLHVFMGLQRAFFVYGFAHFRYICTFKMVILNFHVFVLGIFVFRSFWKFWSFWNFDLLVSGMFCSKAGLLFWFFASRRVFCLVGGVFLRAGGFVCFFLCLFARRLRTRSTYACPRAVDFELLGLLCIDCCAVSFFRVVFCFLMTVNRTPSKP